MGNLEFTKVPVAGAARGQVIEPLVRFRERHLATGNPLENLGGGHPLRVGFGKSWSRPRPNTFRMRSSSFSEYPIALRKSSIRETLAHYGDRVKVADLRQPPWALLPLTTEQSAALWKRATRRRRAIAMGIGCIAVSILCSSFHYSSYSTFVWEQPRTIQGRQQILRRVIGSEKQPGLEDAAGSDTELLKNHNYDSDQVWTPQSVRSARLQVFGSFLLMFFLLTLGLATLSPSLKH